MRSFWKSINKYTFTNPFFYIKRPPNYNGLNFDKLKKYLFLLFRLLDCNVSFKFCTHFLSLGSLSYKKVSPSNLPSPFHRTRRGTKVWPASKNFRCFRNQPNGVFLRTIFFTLYSKVYLCRLFPSESSFSQFQFLMVTWNIFQNKNGNSFVSVVLL